MEEQWVVMIKYISSLSSSDCGPVALHGLQSSLKKLKNINSGCRRNEVLRFFNGMDNFKGVWTEIIGSLHNLFSKTVLDDSGIPYAPDHNWFKTLKKNSRAMVIRTVETSHCIICFNELSPVPNIAISPCNHR